MAGLLCSWFLLLSLLTPLSSFEVAPSAQSDGFRRTKKGWNQEELQELKEEYLAQVRQEGLQEDAAWLERAHHTKPLHNGDHHRNPTTPGHSSSHKDGAPKLAPLQPPPELTQNLHLRYDPSMNAHILLASPCYGGMVTEGFALSLAEIFSRVTSVKGLSMSIKLLPGDSLVTRARNTLVALFLGEPQYTHLLFVDTDITFTTDNVFRLLEMSKKKPIVAAPYPKKGLQFEGLRRHIKTVLKKDPNHEFTDEELSDALIDYVFNSFSENDGSPAGRPMRMEDGFVQVDNAGTGFMMIRRDVLTTMAEYYSDLKYRNDILAYASAATSDNFYGLFDTMIDPSSRRLLSEDYAFCRRAQALGFDVWLDLYADLKHQGTYNFDGNFANSFVVHVD